VLHIGIEFIIVVRAADYLLKNHIMNKKKEC
jgi:hypothetical protein